ncbi:hypothetical protein BEL05_08645 [Shewanella colwelliana]|uniref:Uncharacterized protein n=1 Tax=Shewanella colwelliana TaxID=23 RepID=A0A1E5IXI0_SHECO|nr:hypothetical protein [Shewanella colwelliana]OEG75271.1 hypothetical protein BEL05_08645 [Shewanella colwelliana]
MTIVHKNVISFLLGSSFAYLFVWLIGVVAAMPVPEFIRPYNEFVVSYYSNILIVIFAAVLSFIIMFVVRKVFTLFTKQNLFYFALPIVLFLTYLLVFLSFAVAPLMFAAIPTLLIAVLISSGTKKI